jgi:short-subunit dehydrogenase
MAKANGKGTTRVTGASNGIGAVYAVLLSARSYGGAGS